MPRGLWTGNNWCEEVYSYILDDYISSIATLVNVSTSSSSSSASSPNDNKLKFLRSISLLSKLYNYSNALGHNGTTHAVVAKAPNVLCKTICVCMTCFCLILNCIVSKTVHLYFLKQHVSLGWEVAFLVFLVFQNLGVPVFSVSNRALVSINNKLLIYHCNDTQ